MPKIVQYAPNQVETQVVAGPKAGSAPAAAFGGDIAAGLGNLAKATFDMKNRIDTTSAEEALIKFERDKNDTFFNPDTGYFNTQGKNAYDSSIETTKRLEDLQKSHGESLNPDAKLMFDAVAAKHITKGNADIARHASKGLKAWEVSTIEAQTENSLENASLYWSDPENLRVQNVLGRQSVIDSSEMLGDSPESKAEKLQTFESTFASNTIAAATQNSAAEGQVAFDQYGSKLEGPDAVKIKKIIESKAEVEKTEADAIAATTLASKYIRQDLDRGEILKEADKIKDPELKKKVLSESMTQFNQKKTAEKEKESAFYDEGIAAVNTGSTPLQFQAANAAAWKGMSDTQRNNLLAGKHMTTDQAKLQNILSLPRSQLAKIEPAEYSDSMRPSDVKQIRTAVDKAKKGQSVTSIQTPARKTKMIAEQFFGKEKTWKNSKSKSAKVQELMNAVQGEIEDAESDKGGKLLPSELDTLLAGFSREFVVERSAFGLDFLAGDIDFDLSNTPPEQISEMSELVDKHGQASFQAAVNFLDSKDKPVTVDNILKALRQVKVTK